MDAGNSGSAPGRCSVAFTSSWVSGFHDVRVASQIATPLAFRKLILVAIFNDVFFFLRLALVYTRLGPMR